MADYYLGRGLIFIVFLFSLFVCFVLLTILLRRKRDLYEQFFFKF